MKSSLAIVPRQEGNACSEDSAIKGLFSSPEAQIGRVLEINKAVWKDGSITNQAILRLGAPPWCPPSDKDHLWAVVLVSETGDHFQTLQRNWEAAVYVHGNDAGGKPRTSKWDAFLFNPQGIRPRQGGKPRPVGLRWVVVELGRTYQKESVGQVLSGVNVKIDTMVDSTGKSTVMRVNDREWLGAELPLIAAIHPEWARSMNGTTIPYVNAPDTEVTMCAWQEGDHGALRLKFEKGCVHLHAAFIHNPSISRSYGSGFCR